MPEVASKNTLVRLLLDTKDPKFAEGLNLSDVMKVVDCESTFAYLFGIDLDILEFIWLNMAKSGKTTVAGDKTLGFLLQYFHTTEIVNVYDFFAMMAEKVVSDPTGAETFRGSIGRA